VAEVIEGTFDLIMQGKKEAYNDAVLRALHTLSAEQNLISVAQLSMVHAAQQFEEQTTRTIIHPLGAIVEHVKKNMAGTL